MAPILSNPIALPDFYFNWSLLPAASIVSRVKSIVCIVSSVVQFSNYIPRLEGTLVSRNSFLSFEATTKTALKVLMTRNTKRFIILFERAFKMV